jgi:hypothetical protein
MIVTSPNPNPNPFFIISFSNPLAMSNTQLLRTYSEIDPRIRPLAYIIKVILSLGCSVVSVAFLLFMWLFSYALLAGLRFTCRGYIF